MRAKLSSLLQQSSLFFQDLTRSEPALSVSGKFVKGINFGGEALTIQGNRWESEQSALQAGLMLPAAQQLQTNLLPQPYASQPMRQMLNTLVYRPQKLELTQILPNGSYQLYLWLIENYQSDWHALELRLNDSPVAQNLGKLPLGHWACYGGYAVTLSDGQLRLSLSAHRPDVDAHLMGLSIFRV